MVGEWDAWASVESSMIDKQKPATPRSLFERMRACQRFDFFAFFFFADFLPVVFFATALAGDFHFFAAFFFAAVFGFFLAVFLAAFFFTGIFDLGAGKS
jgi:hypothetical protein